MTVRTAAVWSAVWIGLAVAFGGLLWSLEGAEAGEAYLAGYVMEKALSLDNVFVFTLAYGELTGEKIPTALTLAVIVGVLALAVGASVLKQRRTASA